MTKEAVPRPHDGEAIRVLFGLPGLHRVNRGAEVAFQSVANEIAKLPGYEVTLAGGGEERPGAAYRFRHVRCVSRERFERWPRVPLLRTDCVYEDLTFFPGLFSACSPRLYDVTVTCNYPYSNWAMRLRAQRGKRLTHVFVTQNGDWPPRQANSEFRLFRCDGLVCTNPEYYERHRERWFCKLIPNGVDLTAFTPGKGDRSALNLPGDAHLVLMVSALIRSKRVLEGIRCVARLEGAHMVVAGDGPLRDEVERAGAELLGGRFRLVNVPPTEMPALYRSASVLLHMSQDEPFGNIFVEGLATGLPIVAHDSVSTRWILEDGALLVDTDDFGAVAEALTSAVNADAGDERAKRREMAEDRFSWRAIAKRYAEFFAECRERASV